jgi:lipopolysaccharide biosynthesis regulator YciM
LDYSNQLTHLYAGILAIEEDNLGQARNHLMKAQATDEYTSLYAITLMGDVMFRSGEKNTAMVMWKKVISMNQRYIPAWERILNFNQ